MGRHERYPSEFQILGYCWVPGTEKIPEVAVPLGTKEILEVGYRPDKNFVYRWVPGTDQISIQAGPLALS